MSIQDVVVYNREELGKAASGRLRRSGSLPAVVYGLDGESSSVATEPKLINQILHSEKGSNTVLNLRLEGTEQTRHVMIKAVDRHPVTGRLIHIDFLRIDMNRKVTAILPIEVKGVPAGVKLMGGLLTIVRHEIEVTCLPQDIPSRLEVDVSHLNVDDALRVSDLPELEGVQYELAPKRTIAIVQPPDSSGVVEGEDEEEDEEEEVEV